ncbi:MAG: discoidin domain-containing protein [Propionibacteriaceae bacterium]|nr:discoidin domain-containing protein [Propionibacteriaceae bacterium]
MRKRQISPTPSEPLDQGRWLDLDRNAQVEYSSEDPAHPVEAALLGSGGAGWRAAEPGPQTIRILFDTPQDLRLIRIEFRESEVGRTQEYVLRWSGDGREFRDIVRQQWNFSPGGSPEQVEEHRVELAEVTVLSLEITPDIGGGGAVASLQRLCVR